MLRLVWIVVFFFFSSRRRHTRFDCDWSSDVCSSDLGAALKSINTGLFADLASASAASASLFQSTNISLPSQVFNRSEEHTSELQSQSNLVCRLLLEKKKIIHCNLSTTDKKYLNTR